jgi:hypothetical protein
MLSFLGSAPVPLSDAQQPARNTAGAATHRTANVGRLGLWTALHVVVAVAVTRPVLDEDIWWHLRTGQWIVAQGGVPQTDPFSSYGQGRTWVAYSWLFEVLVSGLHHALGLHGIVLYRVLMSFAVIAALHRFVVKREPRFLPAFGLFSAALLALLPLLSERPWLFTILFTTWTLDVVLDLRAGRATPRVWLLPLVFLVWANVHVQFVYGLGVLLLGCLAPILDCVLGRDGVARVNGKAWYQLVGLSLTCLLATLVNPYHVGLYDVVFEYAAQPGPYRLIAELTALGFRDLWDWSVLGLTLGAVFALGRRPRLSAFDVLLLGATAYFSFRARRDLWFVTLAALAILTVPGRRMASLVATSRLTRRATAVLATALVVVVALTAGVRGLSRAGLERAVAQKFPVRAAAFIEERGYAGPVYNHCNWGGYLIRALPRLPVAIDGRTNLHGDERLLRTGRTWEGLSGWDDDQELSAANLVIADPGTALTAILRRDTCFEVVFEDGVAVVFLRREPRACDPATAK